MHIRYWGHFGEKPTGFGIAAQGYLRALLSTDTDTVVVQSLDLAVAPDFDIVETDLEIVHTMPAVLTRLHEVPWYKPAKKRIACTTFEARPAREAVAAHLAQKFDLTIVPSDFCARALAEAVETPIRVVPHVASKGFRPRSMPLAPSPFIFYSMGPMNSRKRMDDVVRAYLQEFTVEDDVLLHIWLSGEVDWGYFNAIIQSSGLPQSRTPRMRVEPQPKGLGEADIADFHKKGHCYVTASRGEGWGLCLFEAALTGRTIVAPLFGGYLDFLRGYEGFYPASVIADPVFPQIIGGRRLGMPTDYSCQQIWCRPSLLRMGHQMRQAYEDWQEDPHPFDRAPYQPKAIGARLLEIAKEIV